MSLLYHGFKPSKQRRNFKYTNGYVVPATDKEDADGIDVWVKMPRDSRFFPVQITQRGVRLHKKYHRGTEYAATEFAKMGLKKQIGA